MEITSENFEAQFELIRESIMTAEFIAIDTEFSGNYYAYLLTMKITNRVILIYIFCV